jgi:hypothetical protein
MKYFVIFFIIIFVLGCSNRTSLKTGTYKFIRPSKVQFGYLYLTKGIKRCFVGSEIRLNTDSTCKYTTCSTIMDGKWTSTKDSLFLTIIKIRWRIDSLDKYGFNGTWPKLPAKPVGFKFSNDFLTKIHILKNGEKVIEKLKFNAP